MRKRKVKKESFIEVYKVYLGRTLFGFFWDTHESTELAHKYGAQVERITCVRRNDEYVELTHNKVKVEELNYDLIEREELIRANALKKLTKEEMDVLGLR